MTHDLLQKEKFGRSRTIEKSDGSYVLCIVKSKASIRQDGCLEHGWICEKKFYYSVDVSKRKRVSTKKYRYSSMGC